MIKFGLEEYHRNVSKEELVNDLKRVALKLRKNAITHEEYNKYGKFHSCTIYRKFGSWFKALDSASLKRTRNFGVTDEEWFKNLEEVWTKIGRQPHYDDLQKPLSKYPACSYAHRFGSWRKALEKFVEYVNQEEISTSENDIKNVIVDNRQAKYEQKHKTKRNISWRLRFIVMKRDNFKCKGCGRSPATDQKIVLHVDHISPYSKGGETVLGNLQTLCSICNLGKGDL